MVTGDLDTGAAAGIVVVGRIQGPYGVRGWVHVATFTDPKDNLLSYHPWLIRKTVGSDQSWQELNVAEARPHKQGFVVRLDGVSDRDAAAALKGCLIGTPETVLPATEADEYYWRDLMGLTVCNRSGEVLGRVVDLLETGANDVLVVETRRVLPDQSGTSGDAEGSRESELLIPFHHRYVLEVDVEAGLIRVDWQDE